MTDQPVIGLMLGDVTGIGPEICVKLLSSPAARQWARVVAVGDLRVRRQGMADAGQQLDVQVVRSLEEIDWGRSAVPFVDRADTDPAAFTRGELSAPAGRLAGETLHWMTQQALAGRLDGICFAPLNKAALNYAGGRTWGGIHWRSDAAVSFAQGENLVISILREQKATFAEPFEGFAFTRFDGSKVTI